MKKSKIIVPALAVLLLSTAASVTGTVAWFTASRTFLMTAGDFAVVNTKDNLECKLLGDFGTIADDAAHKISTKDGFKLTDASFDHTDVNVPVIEPDGEGAIIEDKLGLAKVNAVPGSALAADGTGSAGVDYFTKDASVDAGFLDDGTSKYVYAGTGTDVHADVADKYYAMTDVGAHLISESALKRDATLDIYSAFTWKMNFKVSFSAGSTKKVGLFLDLNNENTWVRKADPVVFTAEEKITAKTAGTYYTDAACTTGTKEAAVNDVVGASGKITAGTWYRKDPMDTGKGFRLAFVPTTVQTGSYGVAKVWADNQTAAKSSYVDETTGMVLAGTAYNTATVKNIGAGLVAETAGSGKVLMDSADATAVPAADTKSSTSALSENSNYLGYFAPGAGKTVEMTYTVYAWYEGTDENIVNTSATIYETVKTSMQFGVARLTD